MQIKERYILKRALTAARELNIYCWVVGGWIRDTFDQNFVNMGESIHDIDIVATGSIGQLGERLAELIGGSFFVLDQERQIFRVIEPNGFSVDIAKMHGANINDDLKDRDFTVNAMACELRTLIEVSGNPEIIDPFGGREDVIGGLVRAVSPDVFVRDPLRIIRAVRIAAEKSWSIDSITWAQLVRDISLIENIPGERIRDELARILSLPESWHAVSDLADAGFFNHLGLSRPNCELLKIIETEIMAGCILPEETKAAAIKYFKNRSVGDRNYEFILKVSALIPDIDRRGFYHLSKRLMLARSERDTLKKVTEYDEDAMEDLFKDKWELIAHRLVRDLKKAIPVILLLYMGRHLRKGILSDPKVERLVKFLDSYFGTGLDLSPKPIMGGNKIKELFPQIPAANYGSIIAELIEAQVAGVVTNIEEAISFLKRII